MKLNDIKDLEKVMKLCRKMGVEAIEIDGVKFQLSKEYQSPTQYVDTRQQYSPSITPGGITEDTKIVTDELTEEQILMWSAQANDQPEV